VTHRLPILALPVGDQRYSCHGCGNCCRDFTVQLRDEDLAKLAAQDWERILGEPVTVAFRGTRYLRQREDGACVFLMPDGLCRIHADHGFEAKPIACQLFPFHVAPTERGVAMGLSFACQSVQENKGAALRTHTGDLGRMAAELGELRPKAGPPLLARGLPAEAREVKATQEKLGAWMRRTEIPLALRLDGLAWLASSLASATLETVRGARYVELLDVLVGALPDELALLPFDPPTSRQLRLLRQAVFARTEDPKLSAIERLGRVRMTWSQLRRSRRFAFARGDVPRIGAGWPAGVPFAVIDDVGGATDEQEMTAIEDLLTRYVRSSLLGVRLWGPGYYGWPVVDGLTAMVLAITTTGWLARVHAAGAGRAAIIADDVRAALGRIDRTSGRARWLGTPAERLRIGYLRRDDGLRRLLSTYSPVG
jgi:lysine-N-methylase